MAEKKVRLATADWRVARFEHGVEGAEPVVSEPAGGTEVPAGKVEAVEEAARKAGLELKRL